MHARDILWNIFLLHVFSSVWLGCERHLRAVINDMGWAGTDRDEDSEQAVVEVAKEMLKWHKQQKSDKSFTMTITNVHDWQMNRTWILRLNNPERPVIETIKAKAGETSKEQHKWKAHAADIKAVRCVGWRFSLWQISIDWSSKPLIFMFRYTKHQAHVADFDASIEEPCSRALRFGYQLRVPSFYSEMICRRSGFLRPVSVEVLWSSFQHVYILETMQKSFISIKLSLFLWNFYHLSLSVWCHISIFNTYKTLMKHHWDWPSKTRHPKEKIDFKASNILATPAY
jgi:hypothetical protein